MKVYPYTFMASPWQALKGLLAQFAIFHVRSDCRSFGIGAHYCWIHCSNLESGISNNKLKYVAMAYELRAHPSGVRNRET